MQGNGRGGCQRCSHAPEPLREKFCEEPKAEVGDDGPDRGGGYNSGPHQVGDNLLKLFHL